MISWIWKTCRVILGNSGKYRLSLKLIDLDFIRNVPVKIQLMQNCFYLPFKKNLICNMICVNNLFLYMTKLTLHLGSGKIVSTTLVPRAFFRRPVGNFRVLGGTSKKICSGNRYLIKMLYIHIGLLVKKTSQLEKMKHIWNKTKTGFGQSHSRPMFSPV